MRPQLQGSVKLQMWAYVAVLSGGLSHVYLKKLSKTQAPTSSTHSLTNSSMQHASFFDIIIYMINFVTSTN
ncbi:hypothetical protein GBA52_012346 [Prunus armeniaca]|nr:hypothetical protein GBA52_012346 [Prunus armeniaca]